MCATSSPSRGDERAGARRPAVTAQQKSTTTRTTCRAPTPAARQAERRAGRPARDHPAGVAGRGRRPQRDHRAEQRSAAGTNWRRASRRSSRPAPAGAGRGGPAAAARRRGCPARARRPPGSRAPASAGQHLLALELRIRQARSASRRRCRRDARLGVGGQGVDDQGRQAAPQRRGGDGGDRLAPASATARDRRALGARAAGAARGRQRACRSAPGWIGQSAAASGAGGRRPDAEADLAPVPPITRSATRSPWRMACSASAAAARDGEVEAAGGAVDAARAAVVGDRVDDQQQRGVLLGAGRGDVELAGAAETRQLIRRSRSPGWNSRMPANSLPTPARAERWAPTRPARLRRLGPRGVRPSAGQHLQLRAGQRHRSPAVTRPTGGKRHPLLARAPGVPSDAG